MIVQFWSDTNQRGFEDALDALGVTLMSVNFYQYEIPEQLWELASEWGATEIINDEP